MIPTTTAVSTRLFLHTLFQKKVVKNVEFDLIFEIEQHLIAHIQSVSEMVQTLFSC